MPSPKPRENLSQFVKRYMGSGEAQESFPDQKQRAAVAYSIYRKRKKKR